MPKVHYFCYRTRINHRAILVCIVSLSCAKIDLFTMFSYSKVDEILYYYFQSSISSSIFPILFSINWKLVGFMNGWNSVSQMRIENWAWFLEMLWAESTYNIYEKKYRFVNEFRSFSIVKCSDIISD